MDQVRKLPPRPQTWNLLCHWALGRPCLRNSAGISLSVSVRRSEQTTSFGLEREPVLPLVPVSGVVASDGEANIVQGDFSYWKVNYRWGGRPYPGVTAKANLIDSSLPPDIVEFSYTGGTMKDFTPLW